MTVQYEKLHCFPSHPSAYRGQLSNLAIREMPFPFHGFGLKGRANDEPKWSFFLSW